MHEYTVIGHPREKVIFGITVISLFISNSLSSYLNKWLEQYLNFTATFSLSAFTVFGLLYLLFNHCIWKVEFFEKLFHFPNLNGEWECDGLSNNIALGEKFDWEGTVIIKQSWDKILISLKTKTSTSQSMSVTGGIKYYAGVGYKLSYHYENTPNASSDDLRKHEGFCILTFSEDRKVSDGCYFNNIKDRQSYGEMRLIRS